MEKSPALIIDPDPEFLESIRERATEAAVPEMSPPVLASSGQEAAEALANPEITFSGIFVNPRVPEGSVISILKLAHQIRLGTPIYLIRDPQSPGLADAEMERLAIQKSIEKPVGYADLISHVLPIIERQGQQQGQRPEEEAPPSPAANLARPEEDEKYVPIIGRNFVSGSRSFFDVFVRTLSGRYLQVLKAGDAFGEDRIRNYLRRGVVHLYVRKDAQRSYLEYCDLLAERVLRNPTVAPAAKTSLVLNFGYETTRYLSSRGVRPETLRQAKAFVGLLAGMLQKPAFLANAMTNRFMTDLELYGHGVGTATIAYLILLHFESSTERFMKTLGLASLLHDIGKTGGDSETLSHPARSARILAGIGELNPVVIEAVAHHHERRTGDGFPHGLEAGAISRAAELVGISDEFSQQITCWAKNPASDPLEEMRRNHFNGFSAQVIRAFQKAFGFE